MCRSDLSLDLVPNPRFAGCIGQQCRIQQRNERALKRFWRAIRLVTQQCTQDAFLLYGRFGSQLWLPKFLRQGLNQSSRQRDASLDTYLLWKTVDRPLHEHRHVERQAVCSLGLPQWLPARSQASSKVGKLCLERLTDEFLVEAALKTRHVGKLTAPQAMAHTP